MNSKQVIERLEQTRLALETLKPFNGKKPLESKLRKHVHFLSTHKSDDIAHHFIKQTQMEMERMCAAIPDRKADISGAIRVLDGKIVLTGNTSEL